MLHWRHLPDLLIFASTVLIQLAVLRWLLRGPLAAASVRTKRWLMAGAAASILLLAQGFVLGSATVQLYVPIAYALWMRGLAIAWIPVSLGVFAAFLISRRLPTIRPDYDPSRRRFLKTARTAMFLAPAATLGYGVYVARSRLRLREIEMPIAGLPKGLHGLKIVQLTDIHLSPFLSQEELSRAVALANEARAHIAVITGDLISTGSDPLETCIQELSKLRADAGVYGCLGNHEIYANAQNRATELGARAGIQFLRGTARTLRFGGHTLNLAGVDYQRLARPYLIGAEKLVAPGAVNVLLSHNPDVFPVAVEKGFAATFSGHTHGGQVKVEILGQNLSIARFLTPYVDGLYTRNGAGLFVSRGIGTIGIPARLGAPPEVALVKLCAT